MKYKLGSFLFGLIIGIGISTISLCILMTNNKIVDKEVVGLTTSEVLNIMDRCNIKFH
jgi:hypothetical protein